MPLPLSHLPPAPTSSRQRQLKRKQTLLLLHRRRLQRKPLPMLLYILSVPTADRFVTFFISLCCWNQDRFHWQNLDDTIDGIIKSPPQVPALRRHLIRCDGKLPREHFHRVDLAEIFRTHTLFCQTEPWRSISSKISSTKYKATCKRSTGF